MTKDSSSTNRSHAGTSDRFIQALRQTLEYITDSEWLGKNSPLTSLFFTGASIRSPRKRQVVLTGLPAVDERLRALWQWWESQPKIALQSLIWEAICHLPPDLETHFQAILLLTYFETPRPKQGAVIKLLALGRSTYYRYLERAVESLGDVLVQSLRPALQLERPEARPLIGRTELLIQTQKALEAGRIVHLVGGAGTGKTSLGAHLAAQWQKGSVFWYTFRPGLTDHVDQLLFALAYFLHQQGASALWLYLNTNPQPANIGAALLVLRQHLIDLAATPPLFCFDEVDLLLTESRNSGDQHAQIRHLLDDLAHTGRGGAPLLLIGQRLLFEPEVNSLITLPPLTTVDIALLLQDAQVILDQSAQERLLAVTRGNALLLRLFLALHQRGAVLHETLQMLTQPLTLDWFMARLGRHLASAEWVVLQELAVFQGGAPRTAWRRSQKHVNALLSLGLVEAVGFDSISLHPAIRSHLYNLLPPERARELHLAAANLLAEQSRFTLAAWHYIQGGRPEMAIWTWYSHRQQEIDQGQANAALALFAPLAQTPLPTVSDQRALALLLAPLSARAGRVREGLTLLDQVSWQSSSPSTAQAQALRGELLAETGEIERSLAEYRRSLESLAQLRITQEVDLRLQMGRKALVYLGDNQQARQEVMQARLDLEVLQGEVEDNAGNYQAARTHYTTALELAQRVANDQRLGRLHEALGILEARYGDLDQAIHHLQRAGHHYTIAGNLVAAQGMTNSSLAFAYLLRQRYADVITPAQDALDFFQQLNHSYWQAINEAYLAEAWFYLGDLENAERYAQSGLRREEVVVRPYCLAMLGQVRRVQRRLEEAERFCREAIATGDLMQDPWALAPAWRALGETLRAAGRESEAHDAFQEALRIHQKLGVEQEMANILALLKG